MAGEGPAHKRVSGLGPEHEIPGSWPGALPRELAALVAESWCSAVPGPKSLLRLNHKTLGFPFGVAVSK